MPRGRPLAPLEIGVEDRETLERLVARRKTAQALAQRARLILGCAEGKSNKEVSAQVGLSAQTVGKWRRRFLERGLDGLLDEPRAGAPRKITDADVERVVTLTLETTPDDATHWSTRSMASRTGMSQSAISRIWRAFSLQPHRSETFKLSTDSSLHREGPRHSWAVPQPAGQGSRTVRRREIGVSKRWTVPRLCCPCVRDKSRDVLTTTLGTEPPTCSPPLT